MNLQATIFVLNTKSWALTDEKTGQAKSGTSINYLQTEKLDAFEDLTTGNKGYDPMKCSVDGSLAKKLGPVPGFYTASFMLKAVGGKPSLTIVDVSPIVEKK
jgi:hypothetical protein